MSSSSSKRRRYDDHEEDGDRRRDRDDGGGRDRGGGGGGERDRERDSHRDRSRSRDRSTRDSRYSRDDDYDRDSRDHRSSRRRDSPTQSRDHHDSSSRRGGAAGPSTSTSSSSRRDRSRDRDSPRETRREDREREDSGRHRDHRERERRSDDNNNHSSSYHRSPRSRSPDKRDSPLRVDRLATPDLVKKPAAFRSTFSTHAASPSAASNGTQASAPTTPASPAHSSSTKSATTGEEDEKLRIKREKLEAWKAKKAASAAASPAPPSPSPIATPLPTTSTSKSSSTSTKPVPVAKKDTSTTKTKSQASSSLPVLGGSSSSNDPATRALAAAVAIASRITPSIGGGTLPNGKSGIPTNSSLPAKPSFTFTSTTNAFKPSGLKNSLRLGQDEEVEETRMGLMEFGDSDDVNMDVNLVEGEEEEEDEEDLEGGVVYQAREGGRLAGRAVAPEEEEDEAEGEDKMDVDTASVEQAVEEEEEDDELEMFMSGVQAQVKTVDREDRAKLGSDKSKNTLLIEPEAREEDPEAGSEDEVDKVGDSAADILAIAAKKVVKRGRELTAVDHSKITYEPFRKAFYHAPPEVDLLTPEEVEEMRIEMDGIKVRGADPPKPAAKWSYCGLPAACIDVIKGLGYVAPTSIQAQAIPAIMSGRDIIGVAKTGSGKTIAFLLPMLRHVKDQRPLRSMEGPIAMIMTPTRELATQIFKECKPFLKALGLRASCAYGGTPLKDNIADMKRGSELVVCTPGRMIELLTTNSGRIINLQRVSYLVLDEADRMFDMGFEPQVMKIINQIRPDRQTVLFSATFPRQMEALARKILSRPLEITVGGRSIVAPDIEQIVEVREEDTKFNRLLELLGRLTNEDKDARALVFVERQDSADQLLQNLLKKNYSCMSLHGGMEQVDRDQTIADFKTGVIPIVIATSVAARGLDVKQLKLVVQYDAPNHMEDYVHRAGRTGRAGNKGTCVTFVTPEQDRYALDIFKALTASAATIPDDLKALAESFAEKVKAGKESASSGFGGKGLERLDNDRDAQSRAERAAYGESAVEKKAEDPTATGTTVTAPATVADDVADLEIEIKRGPAPDTSKKVAPTPVLDSATAEATIKAAEDALIASGVPAGVAKAKSVLAAYNAMLNKAKTARAAENDTSTDSARRRDPDATDFHAIIYINDYPQKARWKVTNKETMVHLGESTGASITNKGVYYEPGKEPGPDDLPKLHLLIESNDEFRVKHAISEVKRSLIEGATMALEAEQRNPGGSGPPGRYNVV